MPPPLGVQGHQRKAHEGACLDLSDPDVFYFIYIFPSKSTSGHDQVAIRIPVGIKNRLYHFCCFCFRVRRRHTGHAAKLVAP